MSSEPLDVKRRSLFLNGGYMPRFVNTHGELSETQQDILGQLIKLYFQQRPHIESPSLYDKEAMYKLAKFADGLEDAKKQLSKRNHIIEAKGRAPSSQSHANFVIWYGTTEGNRRYELFTNTVSERASRNVHKTIGTEQAKQKAQESRALQRAAQYEEDPLCWKKQSPLSVHFYYELGIYDQETIDSFRNEHLKKCKNNLESMIERYGDEEGSRRYEEMIEKTKATKEQQIADGTWTGSGGVSKASCAFFAKVIHQLIRTRPDIELQHIHCGIDGCQNEWWVRDMDFDNKLYFFDFTIPTCGIIIEYNGTAFHPRTRDQWDEKSGLLTCSTEYAYDYDVQKQKSAQNAGFDIHYVWSDQEDVEACMTFILERLDG